MSERNNAVGDKSVGTSVVASEEQSEGSRPLERIPTQDAEDEVATHVSESDTALQAIRSSSRHIIDLFVPVSLCMLIVVTTVNTVPSISRVKTNLGTVVFGVESSQKPDFTTVLWHALSIALIFLGVIIVMSIALLALYIYRFYKVLRTFLFFCSVIVLFFFCFMYILEVLTNYNRAMDYITVAIVVWNYGVVGLIAIHFSGPIILQQCYLIVNSALLALNFIKLLPDWSIWLLLAIISVWDLIAVLCPKGPLRVLVETARERDEPLFPSLVYSTRMIWFYGTTEEDEVQAQDEAHEKTKQSASYPLTDVSSDDKKPELVKTSVMGTDGNNSDMAGQLSSPTATPEYKNVLGAGHSLNTDGQASPSGNVTRQNSPRRNVEQFAVRRESSGVKLGLGDFIFYSILVGKASATGDWNTTIACFIAILVGLSMTLLLLFIFRKALPALPISIAFGLTFYFVTSLVVVDFIDQCQLYQIYI